MGFFDIVKKVGSVALDTLDQKGNEIKAQIAAYEQKSDEELIKIVTRTGFAAPSGLQKGAAMKVLNMRGITVEDIKARMQD
jgi:hypothetical protein